MSVAQEGTPLLQVVDVHKVYRQGSLEVEALRGLSLELARGEFTAICGPSGSARARC
jgi:putative ABC transport system ATP-binding protein